METQRPADAVASFRRAMTLNPDDNAAVAYFGQALNTTRQFDEALDLMRKMRAAKRADPRFARVEADALRGKGQVVEGAAVLRALADAQPPSAAAFQALGEYWAAAGRYVEAAEVLGRAVQAFPGDTDVRFQYAAMLERQKRTDDAEKAFREVLASDPEHAPALNYLGYMLAERPDRLADALDLVKRAVAIEPYNGAYLDSLGWIYFKLGRLDEAEDPLRRAALQLPRDSVVQDHWGDFLARRGRLAEAVDAWNQSLAGDGESIDRSAIERKIKQASGRGPRP
jgi:tetratricopeptide (TPR) repeat protein